MILSSNLIFTLCWALLPHKRAYMSSWVGCSGCKWRARTEQEPPAINKITMGSSGADVNKLCLCEAPGACVQCNLSTSAPTSHSGMCGARNTRTATFEDPAAELYMLGRKRHVSRHPRTSLMRMPAPSLCLAPGSTGAAFMRIHMQGI